MAVLKVFCGCTVFLDAGRWKCFSGTQEEMPPSLSNLCRTHFEPENSSTFDVPIAGPPVWLAFYGFVGMALEAWITTIHFVGNDASVKEAVTRLYKMKNDRLSYPDKVVERWRITVCC